MNTKQLNASALINSAKGYINDLMNTKKTIKAVLTDWNVCVSQSGADFSTFDFPVEGWTRKAHVVADLERVIVQLTNIMEGREALQNAPVKRETMVQDIQKGMVVINPVTGDKNTVRMVDDFSCYFIISFTGDMAQQYFDRGETLIVCEAEQATQTINDSVESSTINNEALNMTNLPITPVSLREFYFAFCGNVVGLNECPVTVAGLTMASYIIRNYSHLFVDSVNVDLMNLCSYEVFNNSLTHVNYEGQSLADIINEYDESEDESAPFVTAEQMEQAFNFAVTTCNHRGVDVNQLISGEYTVDMLIEQAQAI